MLNARDAIRGETHTHFMADSQLRGTGESSQNSEGTTIKMSRLLPFGRAKNRADKIGELPHVVIGRLDDSFDGPRMLADRSMSTLKVSASYALVYALWRCHADWCPLSKTLMERS